MDIDNDESQYPLSFREQDTLEIARHIQKSNSVEIIGMKRVGISHFLRYFYTSKSVWNKFFAKEQRIFVYVDLNYLVEKELLAFWRLTLKRLIDSIEETNLDPDLQSQIKKLFQDSIQTHDIFLTVDAVREAARRLTQADYRVTIFLVRFDRLNGTYNADFYNNLKAMVDNCNHNLNFVLTSYRPLEEINPDRNNSSFFTHKYYLKTAKPEDTKLIFETFNTRFSLNLAADTKEKVLSLAAGHINYLHLILVELLENKDIDFTELVKSDRILAQSEELYINLTSHEKKVIEKLVSDDKLNQEDKSKAKYLWDIGMINANNEIFSKLFSSNIGTLQNQQAEDEKSNTYTKKEHLLFTLLETNLDKICTREQIIAYVWPECSEYGITDWTIDRLVSRLRKKLKTSKSQYQVITIRTRGFKMQKF